MENQIPRLPGGKKKAFPMFLRIVLAIVVCAGVSGVALYYLLHDHGHRLFQTANTVSEYLTAQEFSVSADGTPDTRSIATSFPTAAESTAAPTDDRISISQFATLQLGDNNADVAALQQG